MNNPEPKTNTKCETNYTNEYKTATKTSNYERKSNTKYETNSNTNNYEVYTNSNTSETDTSKRQIVIPTSMELGVIIVIIKLILI